MGSETTVLGLIGSLRAEGYTRVVVRRAIRGAGDVGAETDVLDLRTLDLPVFDPDDPDVGDAPTLRRRIERADALVLGTPMYHGSYSGAIKSAIDYCGFDEFEDTTVGLCCVAGGRFPLSALEHLRTVCRALNAWVLPYQAAVPSAGRAFRDGEFADDALADRIDALGRRVARFAHIDKFPAEFESEENVGARR